MQVWLNGRLHVPFHRVVMNETMSRYSLGFFSVQKSSNLVKAFDEMVDKERPLLYNPFDYGEFLKFFYKEGGIQSKFALKTYCGVSEGSWCFKTCWEYYQWKNMCLSTRFGDCFAKCTLFLYFEHDNFVYRVSLCCLFVLVFVACLNKNQVVFNVSFETWVVRLFPLFQIATQQSTLIDLY